jgi:hypothetical protein
LEKPEPMIGQTWTLDGATDVLITDLVIEPDSRVIRQVEVGPREGAPESLALKEFLSRAVYLEG